MLDDTAEWLLKIKVQYGDPNGLSDQEFYQSARRAQPGVPFDRLELIFGDRKKANERRQAIRRSHLRGNLLRQPELTFEKRSSIAANPAIDRLIELHRCGPPPDYKAQPNSKMNTTPTRPTQRPQVGFSPGDRPHGHGRTTPALPPPALRSGLSSLPKLKCGGGSAGCLLSTSEGRPSDDGTQRMSELLLQIQSSLVGDTKHVS